MVEVEWSGVLGAAVRRSVTPVTSVADHNNRRRASTTSAHYLEGRSHCNKVWTSNNHLCTRHADQSSVWMWIPPPPHCLFFVRKFCAFFLVPFFHGNVWNFNGKTQLLWFLWFSTTHPPGQPTLFHVCIIILLQADTEAKSLMNIKTRASVGETLSSSLLQLFHPDQNDKESARKRLQTSSWLIPKSLDKLATENFCYVFGLLQKEFLHYCRHFFN